MLDTSALVQFLVHGGKLPADEARRALELLGVMMLKHYDHVPLLPRLWQLRHNMSCAVRSPRS